MNNNLRVDLMHALFLLYCAFAVYSSVVAFVRPGEVGAAIFQNLRIPVVVFLYFLVPCVALYFIYRAFWPVHPPLFWSSLLLVGPLSFFIILYFVTSPDWPIGKLLMVSKMPTDVMRVLLSLNFALCLLVAIAGAVTTYALPGKIKQGPHAAEFHEATQSLEKLGDEATQKQTQVQVIKREAVSSVFKEWNDVVKIVLTFITTVLSFVVSMLALKKK
jgi:hypothetical protein